MTVKSTAFAIVCAVITSFSCDSLVVSTKITSTEGVRQSVARIPILYLAGTRAAVPVRVVPVVTLLAVSCDKDRVSTFCAGKVVLSIRRIASIAFSSEGYRVILSAIRAASGTLIDNDVEFSVLGLA